MRGAVTADMGLPEDERVEDAGLESEEEPELPPTKKPKSRERIAA